MKSSDAGVPCGKERPEGRRRCRVVASDRMGDGTGHGRDRGQVEDDVAVADQIVELSFHQVALDDIDPGYISQVRPAPGREVVDDANIAAVFGKTAH